MLFEYYDVKILSHEDQFDEDGEFQGVDRLNMRDNELEVSIPQRFRIVAEDMEWKRNWPVEDIYVMWMVNTFSHEDMHWLLHCLGIDGHKEGLHKINPDYYEPYPQRKIREELEKKDEEDIPW